MTKSGSNRFTGSASYFYRDESLQANSWSRNRSTNPLENSGPAPFDYKQYGYSFGGPIPGAMFKDKLFFFGAQEWVNFFQDHDGDHHGADRGDAPRRLQRAAQSEQRLLQRRARSSRTR